MAITDLALPQVKNLADAILTHHKTPSSNALSEGKDADADKKTAEAMKNMMDFTMREMMKELVFFPETDDETDW